MQELDIQEGSLSSALALGLAVYSLSNHYGTTGLEWKLSPYNVSLPHLDLPRSPFFSLIADGMYKIRTGTTSSQKRLRYGNAPC